jgi:hypothetical protein
MTQADLDPKNILEQILTIVNYEGDKDAFIANFIALCQQNTILALLEGLSQNEQIAFQQQLDLKTTNEEKEQFLGSYFSEEKISEASLVVTKDSFEEMIKELLPTLNITQRDSFEQFIKDSAITLGQL